MNRTQAESTMSAAQLEHGEPARQGKEENSLMAQNKKRPYGTGYVKKVGGKWVIRWREMEIAGDGSRKRVLRYETLEKVTKKGAERILADRLARACHGPARSNVLFQTLAEQWKADVVPMYKYSTQKNHKHILKKHLLPRFGELPLFEITRQHLQGYVADLVKQGYAPKTVDHIHDVLSSVLRSAVKWGHLSENPARGVVMPRLVTVRPKWVLTPLQARELMSKLPPLAKTMVGLIILTGLRRGELFALRWKCLDEDSQSLMITEAVYEGYFDTPKTTKSTRRLPLSDPAFQLLLDWKSTVKTVEANSLIFSTRSGKPISPNNVLNRFVFPACKELGLSRATWLTFRRTYSSWAHDKGVPQKVIAELMGHSNVYTSLNVYTQVMDDSLRKAVNKVGEELFSIVQN